MRIRGTERMVHKQSRSVPVMRTVLEAVAERLRDGDESLLRIPEVCKATGVNYGSVYHHFGSREGVIDAAYEMMFSRDHRGRHGRDSPRPSRPPRPSRSSWPRIEGILGWCRRATPALEPVDAPADRGGVGDPSPTARIIGEAQAKLTNELTTIVQHAQDRGWMRGDVSAALGGRRSSRSWSSGATSTTCRAEPIPESEWSAFIYRLFAVRSRRPDRGGRRLWWMRVWVLARGGGGPGGGRDGRGVGARATLDRPRRPTPRACTAVRAR